MFKQNRKVAVVIPIYKEELNEFEKISLAQCRKILGKYPLVFVAPEGKNFSYFEQSDFVAQFPTKFFQSTKTYNKLLLSPQFYETFLDFDYILIYQLDAFVFYDALEFFCDFGYDYIGAPVAYHSWYGIKIKKVPRVGNGGFSLRKVRTCHKLLTECVALPDWDYILDNFYEDSFFGLCGVDDETDFHVAPVDVAICFAVDYFPDRFLRCVENKIPFGCHGWSKYSADAYIELFRRAGYDLRPIRNKMGNKDYEFALEISLEVTAIKRLIRRINHGQSILKYLPTKRFASIRVIRSPESMKILAGMAQEDSSFTDRIFLYDLKDYPKLINDLRRENLPHLVLSAEYDESLIKQIEERGLIYGKHVISFRREYFKHCEKIFRNLGK